MNSYLPLIESLKFAKPRSQRLVKKPAGSERLADLDDNLSDTAWAIHPFPQVDTSSCYPAPIEKDGGVFIPGVNIFVPEQEATPSAPPPMSSEVIFGTSADAILADYVALYDKEIARRAEAEARLELADDQYEGQQRHFTDLEGQLEKLQIQEQVLSEKITQQNEEMKTSMGYYEKAEDEVIKLKLENQSLKERVKNLLKALNLEVNERQTEVREKNRAIGKLQTELAKAHQTNLMLNEERARDMKELEASSNYFRSFIVAWGTMQEQLGEY